MRLIYESKNDVTPEKESGNCDEIKDMTFALRNSKLKQILDDTDPFIDRTGSTSCIESVDFDEGISPVKKMTNYVMHVNTGKLTIGLDDASLKINTAACEEQSPYKLLPRSKIADIISLKNNRNRTRIRYCKSFEQSKFTDWSYNSKQAKTNTSFISDKKLSGFIQKAHNMISSHKKEISDSIKNRVLKTKIVNRKFSNVQLSNRAMVPKIDISYAKSNVNTTPMSSQRSVMSQIGSSNSRV